MPESGDIILTDNRSDKAILADIIKEVEQTPQEQWKVLLDMIRLFRRSSETQSSSAETWNAVVNQIRNETSQQKAARQQALSKLLQSWEDEGDEQEQKETLEFLQQALNQNRTSNRPLFPFCK
ncbi:hypothetical protein NIES4071_03050 [Calothrix sp. NIES-4071]|nr:hypothetical protein NIES4071_03050 [Calothrix sp. NIES-4071]BAZ54651.1 hypothetical protein NIES4105_03040 [Calothrix sp. NIES-4105]